MPLNIGLAINPQSHEKLSSTGVSNGGLMESFMKNRFKNAFGLPKEMKTFGTNIAAVIDLKNKEADSIREQLTSKGLFFDDFHMDKNFESLGDSTTIFLGLLYDNNDIALELTKDNKVKTSFILKVGNEPTVFSSVSEKNVKEVNFYSLTYDARVINSLPNQYLTELMKRKKGLIVQTGQNGEENIVSANCLIFELIVNDNGEITYKQLTNNADGLKKALQNHTLVNVIYGYN